jgi:hypothetical protein
LYFKAKKDPTVLRKKKIGKNHENPTRVTLKKKHIATASSQPQPKCSSKRMKKCPQKNRHDQRRFMIDRSRSPSSSSASKNNGRIRNSNFQLSVIKRRTERKKQQIAQQQKLSKAKSTANFNKNLEHLTSPGLSKSHDFSKFFQVSAFFFFFLALFHTLINFVLLTIFFIGVLIGGSHT